MVDNKVRSNLIVFTLSGTSLRFHERLLVLMSRIEIINRMHVLKDCERSSKLNYINLIELKLSQIASFPLELRIHVCFYLRLSEIRLVTARTRCPVRVGTCRTCLVNTLESGSLMPALVGGVTLTLMTSKAISSVKRIKDWMLYCTK